MQIVCRRLLFYSFGGWLLEGLYHLLMTGSFWKANFLLGPFKPMYGIAAVLLLGAKPLEKREFFLLAVIIPLVVEYASGFWLKNAFGLQYWDYSGYRYNIDGLVCLQFAVIWIVLAYFWVYGIQPKLAVLKIKYAKSTVLCFWIIWAEYMLDVAYTIYNRLGGGIG